jgi:hypothetical protein
MHICEAFFCMGKACYRLLLQECGLKKSASLSTVHRAVALDGGHLPLRSVRREQRWLSANRLSLAESAMSRRGGIFQQPLVMTTVLASTMAGLAVCWSPR